MIKFHLPLPTLHREKQQGEQPLFKINSAMKENSNQKTPATLPPNAKKGDKLEGYPLYPDNEDIYNKFQKTEMMDADEISSQEQKENGKIGANINKEFEEDQSGSELDVPGAELDDQQEFIGSEDEENNYYSIGGDRHEDMDENTGELDR